MSRLSDNCSIEGESNEIGFDPRDCDPVRRSVEGELEHTKTDGGKDAWSKMVVGEVVVGGSHEMRP